MWETIKNNTLLKTIVVIIQGVLGFGLAFNIMFGRNTGMMEAGMAGGYSLDSTLAYILMILVKLLLVAVVLAALSAVYKYCRKYLLEGGELKLFEPIKNDPAIKAASVIIASVLVIALIAMLFGNIFGGFGAPTNYYYSMGVYRGVGAAAILAFLAKLLLGISVVGLAASVCLLIVQNSPKPGKDNLVNCSCGKCGMALKPGWKCCPNCGEEIIECESGVEAPINQAETTVNKQDENEDIKKNSDSNEGADIYDKLYDSAPEEAIENAKNIRNKKKQNKR